jgi:hypothetical protein
VQTQNKRVQTGANSANRCKQVQTKQVQTGANNPRFCSEIFRLRRAVDLRQRGRYAAPLAGTLVPRILSSSTNDWPGSVVTLMQLYLISEFRHKIDRLTNFRLCRKKIGGYFWPDPGGGIQIPWAAPKGRDTNVPVQGGGTNT